MRSGRWNGADGSCGAPARNGAVAGRGSGRHRHANATAVAEAADNPINKRRRCGSGTVKAS